MANYTVKFGKMHKISPP